MEARKGQGLNIAQMVEDVIGSIECPLSVILPNLSEPGPIVRRLQSIANRTGQSFPVYQREDMLSTRFIEFVVPEEIGGEG